MPDDETQLPSEEPDSTPLATEAGPGLAGRSSGLLQKVLTPRPPGAPRGPRTVKALVDGLDSTERNLAIGAVIFAVVLDLVNFYANRHSPTKDIRQAAEFLLVSNLIFAAILALGFALRRRALLGFGAFFFGLEQAFSEHEVALGLPFIAFGGWLIMRASQKQKQDRPAGRARGSTRSTPRASTKSTKPNPGRPKASKRYTPPQRARGGATR
jgi:hypothetical protein